MANPRFGEAYDPVSAELDNVCFGKATAKEAMERVKPKADKPLAQGMGEL